MVARFAVAALRHLGTADHLERHGRMEDAAYHYGVAGETAVKATLERAGIPFPWKHWDRRENKSLRHAIESMVGVVALLRSGRLGGPLADDLDAGTFSGRFEGWSVDIRYADTDHPVDNAKLATWKADAVLLVNNGAF